ncbi:MAG TPA: Gfo/Idh/MocA family oxidoreductase, partial [Streptosporangiaceae bacterium]|nr:Gfo/Idh/MocA family oxidoreductase [Streptosporangiaceae bacterium]
MIRLGIIGAGDVVRIRHLPILAEFYSDSIKVVAISTRRQYASDEVNSILDYSVPRYTDYRKVLDLDLDCVLVAVPMTITESICIDSLSRSIATYSEKPMAQSYLGALRLRDLARSSKVPYLIGENFYFQRRFEIADRWISDSGERVSGITVR